MLKIDNSLLDDVGLTALPAGEKNSLLKHIYETLEMRVGIRLADQMTNPQLDEFEQYFEAKDDAGAFKWLETNFPNYKDIVQEEFDKLKIEISQSAPHILSASQQQAAAPIEAQHQAAPAPPVMQQPTQPTYYQPVQPTMTEPPTGQYAAQPSYAAPPAPQQPQPASAEPYAPPAPAPAYQPPFPHQQPPAGPTPL